MKGNFPEEAASSTKRNKHPNSIDILVGARLRLRRNLIGLSQTQLGNAIGVTFQQIQKYERGTNRMGASRLYQLSQLLNVSVIWFFDESPAIPQSLSHKISPEYAPDITPQDENIMHRRETLNLVRSYYNIVDPKKRSKIFSLVKSLSSVEAEK